MEELIIIVIALALIFMVVNAVLDGLDKRSRKGASRCKQR
jgi:hypothetical protein